MKHYFVVIDGTRLNLLWWDIFNLVVTDWSQFLKEELVNNENLVLNNLCQKYSDVFSPGLGMMKTVAAHIMLIEG